MRCTMNKLLIPALSLCLTVPVLAQTPEFVREDSYYRSVFEQTYPVTSFPYQLEIKNLQGRVRISAGSDRMIRFREEISVKTGSLSEAEKIYEYSHLEPEISEYGHILEANDKKKQNTPRTRYSYTLTLPVESSLAIQLLSGDIELEGLRGQLAMATYGGDIEAEKCSGNIEFNTAGGDLDVKELEGNIRLYTAGGDIRGVELLGSTSIETAGGDIVIESLRGTLDCETLGGDIMLSNMDAQRITAKTMGGDIAVRNSRSEMTLETAGGDIDVRKMTGDLDGQTMGGRISLQEIKGAVNMKTFGGNITVTGLGGAAELETLSGDISVSKHFDKELREHDLDLETRNGDVYLQIPETPEFRLKATANGSGVEISSDFPLQIQEKDKRRVVASLRSTDYRYDVNIESEDGDITITKGK